MATNDRSVPLPKFWPGGEVLVSVLGKDGSPVTAYRAEVVDASYSVRRNRILYEVACGTGNLTHVVDEAVVSASGKE